MLCSPNSTKSLTKFSSELDVLYLFLGALSVRNEYCQEVVDNGGLQFLHDILVKNTGEAELITLIIKVLAGNDKVKDEVGIVRMDPSDSGGHQQAWHSGGRVWSAAYSFAS